MKVSATSRYRSSFVDEPSHQFGLLSRELTRASESGLPLKLPSALGGSLVGSMMTAGKGLAAAADKAATATKIGVMSMLVPAYAAVIIDGISDVENDLANAKLALVQAEFLAAHSANTDLEEAASLSAAVYVAHARVNGLKVTLAFLNAAT